MLDILLKFDGVGDQIPENQFQSIAICQNRIGAGRFQLDPDIFFVCDKLLRVNDLFQKSGQIDLFYVELNLGNLALCPGEQVFHHIEIFLYGSLHQGNQFLKLLYCKHVIFDQAQNTLHGAEGSPQIVRYNGKQFVFRSVDLFELSFLLLQLGKHLPFFTRGSSHLVEKQDGQQDDQKPNDDQHSLIVDPELLFRLLLYQQPVDIVLPSQLQVILCIGQLLAVGRLIQTVCQYAISHELIVGLLETSLTGIQFMQGFFHIQLVIGVGQELCKLFCGSKVDPCIGRPAFLGVHPAEHKAALEHGRWGVLFASDFESFKQMHFCFPVAFHQRQSSADIVYQIE